MDSNLATVTIQVSAVNDAPVAANQKYAGWQRAVERSRHWASSETASIPAGSRAVLEVDGGVAIVTPGEGEAPHAETASARGRRPPQTGPAIVSGVPKPDSGTIERSISRHPVHRHRMTTGEGGRPSRTDWAVEKKFGERAALNELVAAIAGRRGYMPTYT